ncbi:UDP-glucose--hexose-1-phosphate uridylyltransferase [Paenibacillus sp. GCM10023248]|uniref:UDP-glucose--hexose-1-phosphate uridylyltransferase n=1 Tax=unclassified Paenibacillus TaxID=185978 RepID=UPI002379F366|nr:UDP-glucose--hexose-1-phosphate uridylyltransferase [Paenibacillus sp. MAHUQ-63]MDD9270615.1 UDP-glucose--hexose-1-phosphate uridylyltransferase [Paenibacillus sp. MAHUQ-63]
MERTVKAPAHTALTIERLLQFAIQNELIQGLDVYTSRNALLDLFRLAEPYAGEVPEERLSSPVALLEELLDAAFEAGLLEENTTTYRDLLDARIMGMLMPRPSEVVNQFWHTAKTVSVEAATDYFYKQSIDSNYIRMDRIQKNEYWLAGTAYGELEITVNLSKPEKDPKEIALLKTLPQSSYPACLLCADNLGYAGRVNHPARQNLRIIPLELDNEKWYFQYSPYVYYNEHSIIFHEKHIPMKTTANTFYRLLDFIDQFPHYFIGSNADLPIVGGSILNHDHFQGGRHQFPMEKAPSEQTFTHADYAGVKAAIVKWPMSVIRLSGHSKQSIYKLASKLLDDWRAYSDAEADILAFSEKDGQSVPHNTITPIARNNARGEYELDLVLRNNRTSEEHPDGIFHPHQHLHHIKKENIGLIEVMGLAVLPGRLQEELADIAQILTGAADYGSAIQSDAAHPLHKHAAWIEAMLAQYGASLTADAAKAVLQAEVGSKFMDVLLDAGVFKRDEAGQAAFGRFLAAAGFAQQQ